MNTYTIDRVSVNMTVVASPRNTAADLSGYRVGVGRAANRLVHT